MPVKIPLTFIYFPDRIKDNEGDKKVIKLKTKYFVRIYDFDRSFIIGDTIYDMNFFNDQLSAIEFLGQLNNRIGNNIDFDRLKGQLNSQLIIKNKKEDPKWLEQIKFISFGSATLPPSKYINDIANSVPECLNPYITVYNNITEIPITKENSIFFQQTANIKNIIKDIYGDIPTKGNASWKRLSTLDKLLVCHPLVLMSYENDYTC
jgi:hypothetical protein